MNQSTRKAKRRKAPTVLQGSFAPLSCQYEMSIISRLRSDPRTVCALKCITSLFNSQNFPLN